MVQVPCTPTIMSDYKRAVFRNQPKSNTANQQQRFLVQPTDRCSHLTSMWRLQSSVLQGTRWTLYYHPAEFSPLCNPRVISNDEFISPAIQRYMRMRGKNDPSWSCTRGTSRLGSILLDMAIRPRIVLSKSESPPLTLRTASDEAFDDSA